MPLCVLQNIYRDDLYATLRKLGEAKATGIFIYSPQGTQDCTNSVPNDHRFEG